MSDDIEIELNFANPDDYVPESERNNRVIKERFLISYYQFPYLKYTKDYYQSFDDEPDKKMNLVPHYSPHMILSQSNSDYNKHFQIEFGTYVQASQVNDPNNTNHPRTLDGIYLCPAPNLQGGHQIIDLQTGQFFTRPIFVEIPITDVVINTVEKISED